MSTTFFFLTDLSLRPFCPSVDKLINQSIDQSIGKYWCLGFEIDTACPSIYVFWYRFICLSVDISVRCCILMSSGLLMCPSVHFVCLLIYQFIGKSINRWILMSLIVNRHGPSPSPLDFFCLSIGLFASLLIDNSVNVYWCLLSYLCVPSSVLSIRWYIYQSIDQSIDRWILMYGSLNRHIPSPSLSILISR